MYERVRVLDEHGMFVPWPNQQSIHGYDIHTCRYHLVEERERICDALKRPAEEDCIGDGCRVGEHLVQAGVEAKFVGVKVL
jgi:hypothetical protein